MSKNANEHMESKKFFLLQRRVLLTVSFIIILYDLGLSFLVNAAYGEKLAQAQKSSLLVVLLIWCVYALIRYHHSVRASDKLSLIINGYNEYRDRQLRRAGYVVDVIEYGQNSISEEDWHHYEAATNGKYVIHYIIEEDHDMQQLRIKECEEGGCLSGISYMRKRAAIFWIVLKSFIKFIIHERPACDILVPYFIGMIAILEASGILKVTYALTELGNLLYK